MRIFLLILLFPFFASSQTLGGGKNGDFGIMNYAWTPISSGYILDQLITPSNAAYSLRKLRSAYIGASIRVRRSSDNTETDIGFTSTGQLDGSALLAFVGGGNGFVTIWYDQSGNGRNMIQATAANQPQIVSAGTIFMIGSNPCISTDGINQSLASTYTLSALTSTYTSFIGQRLGNRSAGIASFMFGTGQIGGTGSTFSMITNTNDAQISVNVRVGAVVVSNLGKTIAEPAILGASIRTGGTSARSYLDVNIGVTAAVTFAPNTNPLRVFGTGQANRGWWGYGTEAILFSSDLTDSERLLLLSNQGTYYGITVN
jgi:hypothetical protein